MLVFAEWTDTRKDSLFKFQGPHAPYGGGELNVCLESFGELGCNKAFSSLSVDTVVDEPGPSDSL